MKVKLSFKLSVLCLFLLSSTQVYADGYHPFMKLERKLEKGNKRALYKLADKFDSNKKVKVYMVEQEFEMTESELAKYVIEKYCFFSEDEIVIDESTTKKQFRDFLKANHDKITFSALADAFIFMPLEQRKVDVMIREIPDVRKRDLQKNYKKSMNADWVENAGIDTLIQSRNSLCLLKIASELIKNRNKTYYFEDYLYLIYNLTGTEIAVENEKHEFTWHVEDEFSDIPKLNLLIYFVNHYTEYAWNDQQNAFINPYREIIPAQNEDILCYLLQSKNDSVAMDAFIQLTTCNKDKVIALCDEYEELTSRNKNFSLPTFPYRFLKQLVVLTDYCSKNGIDFIGSDELRAKIEQLKTRMPFAERYKFENDLIASLTLDEITAFEYWSLINEKSWSLMYSAGRIVDIFYSRNWNRLMENPKYLDCYLKKSKLFERLGITGTCNLYLKKFSDLREHQSEAIKNHSSKDANVCEQIGKVLHPSPPTIEEEIVDPEDDQDYPTDGLEVREIREIWEGNKDYHIDSLEIKLSELFKLKDKWEVVKLISKISYSQISVTFKCIEEYQDSLEVGYNFMYDDFGFHVVEYFREKETRDEFLRLHSTCSEYEVYAYYLDQAEIDYKNRDSTLNYDKIYEMLKYDVVEALAGGGIRQDNQVYLLIKLLELTFDTTLGYPHKLCNSQNVFACDSSDRAKDWMKYLEDHQLLFLKHDEPVSFNY